MSKPLSISHSARGKFDHCNYMYFLHYIEKIRPASSTSSLLLGSAMDKACEEYMKSRNRELARRAFRNTWNEQEINGQITDLTASLEIEFHGNDFDAELVPESYNSVLIENTVYPTVPDLIKAGIEKERIAYANWLSLFFKGRLMLIAFMDWVDENVEEVLGCQIPIELEDGEGNKVTGFADFVVKIKGYDKPMLIDLKTAARYYERSSVKESEQLALYFLYLKSTKFPDMERAAFLVLSKQIKKNRKKTCKTCGTITSGREQTCAVGGKGKGRCDGEFDVEITPEANLQYIHDEIEQEFIDQTVEKFNITVEKIKTGVFEKNLEGCDRYYGKPCPYREFCLTGCMTGLIKNEIK